MTEKRRVTDSGWFQLMVALLPYILVFAGFYGAIQVRAAKLDALEIKVNENSRDVVSMKIVVAQQVVLLTEIKESVSRLSNYMMGEGGKCGHNSGNATSIRFQPREPDSGR